MDRIYLIGTDAVLGIWRPDVVDALKAMNPGIIRWGGSTTEGYEWEHCIGPWDQRAPFTTIWGGLEPNFVGMEEFVQLCARVGAEPLLCLRWSGKKPEDAVAQVEYFNGSTGTRWGAIRAKNGHRDPYGVKYWQIGNEVGGDAYDASVREFAGAMKMVDPNIKVLSAFVTEQTLAQGGDCLDYLCPHHYGCADLLGKDRDFQLIREQIRTHEHRQNVRVAVTEWNTTAGDWNLARGSLQTLSNALACARYQNLMHRNADLVEIAIRSNLVDSFGSGVIQTGPGWIYLAPTYCAQQLYQRAVGSYALRVARRSDRPWQEQEPDISATLSPDGKVLRLFAVNTEDGPLPANIRLEGFPARIARGEATVLGDRDAARTAEVMNMRDDPWRVAPQAMAFDPENSPFSVTFAPFALTVLEISFVE